MWETCQRQVNEQQQGDDKAMANAHLPCSHVVRAVNNDVVARYEFQCIFSCETLTESHALDRIVQAKYCTRAVGLHMQTGQQQEKQELQTELLG